MKKLIVMAVVAINAALCVAASSNALVLPEVDANGYRCEGDCDPDTPCQVCNPPKVKKSAAKSKRGEKAARKRSEKKQGAAKKQRKRSSKKQAGARRRSRKPVVETPVAEVE